MTGVQPTATRPSEMTATKHESRREVAERIAERFVYSESQIVIKRKACADAIEAALKERDERAARVIVPIMENHKHYCTSSLSAGSLWVELDAAIRNEKGELNHGY